MQQEQFDMAQLADMVSFVKYLGIQITEVTAEQVTGQLLVRPELTNHLPNAHGGVFMSFADALGAFGAQYHLPEGAEGTTTIESKTNFMRAVQEGDTLHGLCKPLTIGRRLSVWQTDITRGDGKLAAQVTQTQIYLWPLGERS
ncbi:MAG: PaaI family thioesterase [Parvibaculales bacterium]